MRDSFRPPRESTGSAPPSSSPARTGMHRRQAGIRTENARSRSGIWFCRADDRWACLEKPVRARSAVLTTKPAAQGNPKRRDGCEGSRVSCRSRTCDPSQLTRASVQPFICFLSRRFHVSLLAERSAARWLRGRRVAPDQYNPWSLPELRHRSLRYLRKTHKQRPGR
ncbi:hypothetical protein VTK73DRAFT_10414 [Phialemonium thermophilum]|uniref:Uncharacterized protein n=1 Tax=Phialemonium thermophilum TaxID=223376 RepID=A0ABR3VWX8_9PEZI